MKSLVRCLSVLAAGVMTMVGVGCNSAPEMTRHEVTVQLAPELTSGGTVPSINVDLIGVSADDAAKWEAVSLNDYFAKGDSIGGVEKHSMTFAPGNAGPKVLKKDDPIWDKWKGRGVMNLFIFARLPEGSDKTGALDGRRKVVPLGSDRWEHGDEKLTATLNRATIDVTPSPKPPAPPKH